MNAEVHRTIPRGGAGAWLAATFGLCGDGRRRDTEVLYDEFELSIRPGEIVAVVGPSGSGKSVLLCAAAKQIPGAVWLDVNRLARRQSPAIGVLRGGSLSGRLEILSRCGLAEARALLTPACRLSGGQRYRLALAAAIHRAQQGDRPCVVIADEFCSTLDRATAVQLCRQARKMICMSSSGASPSSGRLSLLIATPRAELLGALAPDKIVVKPLCGPPSLHFAGDLSGGLTRLYSRGHRRSDDNPGRWPIICGTLADYRVLASFHYVAGPPAAHKRVYVVRPPRVAPGEPEVAAVLVISPPLSCVRGRNVATAGRYSGPDRRGALRLLNNEIEWISRVVVHPAYRGCGLAVRLIRHAVADARTPRVEALAAMGAIHPLFELAGMSLIGRFTGVRGSYSYYLLDRPQWKGLRIA